MKEDNYRHIYLYAKYHYQMQDKWNDLKILLGHRSGIDPKYISKEDILHILSVLAYNEITNYYHFSTFINDLLPENTCLVGYIHNEESKYEIEEALLYKLLSLIRLTAVKDENGKILLNLDKPDYSILPKRKKERVKFNNGK